MLFFHLLSCPSIFFHHLLPLNPYPRNPSNSFHDVDLLPENQNNIYSCTDLPRHFSSKVNSLRYVMPYPSLFGGVFSFMTDQYRQINGFSNLFEEWGAEDDSLFLRIQHHNMTILRSYDLGYYTMLAHSHASLNPNRQKLIKDSIDQIKTDGLNSVRYKVLDVDQEQYLYTKFLIKLV